MFTIRVTLSEESRLDSSLCSDWHVANSRTPRIYFAAFRSCEGSPISSARPVESPWRRESAVISLL